MPFVNDQAARRESRATTRPITETSLGGALSIAIGVAELRNAYGTGHGRDRRPTGLGPRHGHLAVNAAYLWCQLMLDTLADPRAPWRKL
ncbi:abortive infection family protein (plasmid) [Rhodococcus ruber]|uniref:abortive infection family protein n=1 Tax=Rhodococcus phenolicus TaxID=263849 RepID=UPI0009EEA774|nr:abortive infection family protein [Rhodococcus sp. LW-XY12]UQB75888.1 abortive infection family protein [Rhodococcus ruber]